MMVRRLGFVLLLTAGTVPTLAAQTSVYGVRGLGFPGRPLTARTRALGGGLGAFDPASPINPAAIAGVTQVTAVAVAASDFRGHEIGGVAVGGLNATRFPLIGIAGRWQRHRIGYALSVAQYADRSFDITIADTVSLRGTDVAVVDRTISAGGVSDIRGVLAWAPSGRLRFGVAAHAISGSAKLTLSRQFADSAYRSFQRVNEEGVTGLGVSAGVVWAPVSGFQLGLAGRYDTEADIVIDSAAAGTVDLPAGVVAGMLLAPHPSLRWATTFIWRSWSDADADLTGRAFDTWELGSGIELGGAESGGSRVPLRLGVRYARLPFAPGDEQAHELDLAVGTGVAFAGRRGLLDFALERAFRDGAGASERAWQVAVSLTVRP